MANNVIKRVWNQNRMVAIEDLKGMTFQAESGGHTFQISGVDDAGNVIALSGSVAGVFLRPDNTDVAITGSASGGVVSVTLPANCYDVPGRFGLTVFVTANGQKTAVYAAMGTVSRTSSGTVSPGTTSDVVDLINRINAAVATIPASWTGLMADIAPTYSDAAVYPVGAYCYYNGDLYRCTTAITTAESWTAGHWTQAVLGNDVSDLKSAITQITGNELVPINDNGYIATNGSTVDVSSVVDNANYKHCVIDCNSGDGFTITGKGGETPRLWAFLGAENNGSRTVLDHSIESASANDEIITAPTGTQKLVVNVQKAYDYSLIVGAIVDKRITETNETLQNEISRVETDISDTENNIRSSLQYVTDNATYHINKKCYIKTNESTADISAFIENNSYQCVVVDCSPGDKFTLTGYSGDAGRLWAFLGTNTGNVYQVLQPTAASGAHETDKVLTAPTGATKLVVNTYIDGVSWPFNLCKGEKIISKVNKNSSDISDLANKESGDFATAKQEVYVFTGNAVTELTETGYLNTSGTTVADITAITPSENYLHIIVDCHYGDKFRITGTGGSSPRLWAFLGNKTVSNVYYVLEKAEASESTTDKIITAPVNAEKLVINVNVNSPYMFVQGDYIKSKLKSVEDDLYEYEQITVSERTDGKWLSKNNNINNDAGSCYTGYVPVIPGRTVKLNYIYVGGNRAVCGYDINKNFNNDVIITDNNTTEYNFTVPNNVYFIRITGFANTTPTVWQNKASLAEIRTFYNAANIIVPSYYRKNIVQKKIVTLIDDDGDNETQMANLKDLCDSLGIKCTYAVVTKLMENDASHMQFIKNLQANGFHIANHTNDHSRWYGDSAEGEMFTLAECEEDLLKAFRIFEENGFFDSSKFFVYTGSSADRAGVPELIKKWCECAATITGGVNTPNLSGRFQLNRTLVTPENSRDLNYYKNQLDSYEDQYGDFWMIYYGHCKFAPTGGYSFDLTGGVLDYAMSKGYVPMTYNEAWNYMKGKYMVQEAFAR